MSITVEKVFLCDIMPTAHHIENILHGKLIMPPKGVYVPGKAAPLLIPHDGSAFLDKSSGELDIDSYLRPSNKDESLIDYQKITKAGVKLGFSGVPTLPVYGMIIIKLTIDYLINNFSKFRKNKQTEDDLYASWSKIMLPEFRDYRAYKELYFRIHGLQTDIMEGVTNFLGTEGYIMHFVNVKGVNIYIEKTMDFRIYEWEQRTKEGIW